MSVGLTKDELEKFRKYLVEEQLRWKQTGSSHYDEREAGMSAICADAIEVLDGAAARSMIATSPKDWPLPQKILDAAKK